MRHSRAQGIFSIRLKESIKQSPNHAACSAFQTILIHTSCTTKCFNCALWEIPLIRNFNHQFASRCARREISLCLADALGRERVLSINVDFQGTTRHQSPEFCTVAVAFLEGHQVVEDPDTRGTYVCVSKQHLRKARDIQGTKELDILLY